MTPADTQPHGERLKARFGDTIENGWASEDNPTRVGFFVREGRRTGRMNAGRYFEVTDGHGKFWELPLGTGHKITVHPAARATPPDMVLVKREAIGPRPAKYVCKGCPAYEPKDWREPSGDGETYDTGQYAWCNAARHKSMGAYHYDHSSTPDWCPALASPALPVGGQRFSSLQTSASPRCPPDQVPETAMEAAMGLLYCAACGAFPKHGYCNLRGCPMAKPSFPPVCEPSGGGE